MADFCVFGKPMWLLRQLKAQFLNIGRFGANSSRFFPHRFIAQISEMWKIVLFFQRFTTSPLFRACSFRATCLEVMTYSAKLFC